MDQDVLVKSGQELVRLLDQSAIKPRAAMWVHNPDNDIWRLWIVPQIDIKDKNEFYRIVADVIAKNRESLGGLDISSTKLVKDDHPAIKGMRGYMQIGGLNSIHIIDNTINGFFIPDGIIIRMAV